MACYALAAKDSALRDVVSRVMSLELREGTRGPVESTLSTSQGPHRVDAWTSVRVDGKNRIELMQGPQIPHQVDARVRIGLMGIEWMPGPLPRRSEACIEWVHGADIIPCRTQPTGGPSLS